MLAVIDLLVLNDSKHYTDLDISSKLDFLYKREATSSGSRNYMGISGKGVTTSLDLSTKTPNKKQKSRNAITDITLQYFRKLLKKFKSSPYLD